MRANVIWAVFAGGAIGSAARYFVLLWVTWAGFSQSWLDLVVTTIVNLAGAFVLGIIHGIDSGKSEAWKGFWATGVAGGFTTMSGLALITAGNDLGLSSIGYLYWLAVFLQLVVGVLVYALGKKLVSARLWS